MDKCQITDIEMKLLNKMLYHSKSRFCNLKSQR